MKKPNLVFMYGEDSFSLSEELTRWKQAFISKHSEINLEELHGSQASIEQINSSVLTLPFLGEKRLVILKGFLKANKAEQTKKLVPLLEKLGDHTVFVVVEMGEPDKRSSLFKQLTKQATLRLFVKPKGAQLSTWAVRRAEAHGGHLDHRSANYLVRTVGNDLWKLDNEIQKLCLYARGEEITSEMIDDLVLSSIEQSIFTMTDQIASKNMAGAFKTLRELQEQGQEAPYLFAMISRQFRLMLEMKSLAEQGVNESMIAKKMKVHPFVVKNTVRQCRNFTQPQLKQILKELLHIDRRLKTGKLHLRTREEEQYLLAIEQVLLNRS